jgi:sugar lactone lactonase YvrE
MANDKDFILKNAIEIGGSTKVTVGDAPASGSVTVGYDLSVAAYDSKSLLVSGSESRPITLAISSDGTKLYVGGQTGDALDQYTLSTAYDISTGTYDSVTFSYASSAGLNVQGIFLKPDGTKFFLTDDQNNAVYAYTMSTAFDLSTASYDSVSFSVSSQSSANTNGVEFTSDGTKFFVIGKVGTTPTIYQYNMTTAWDISTASYSNNSLVVTSQLSSGANDIRLNGDATKLYAGSNTANDIFQYDMTTAGDLSTASYSGTSFSTTSETTAIFNFCFGDSGTKLYVCDFSTDTIYQYSTGSTVATETFDTSTGNYFTHTPSADSEYGFSNAGDVQTFQLEVTGNQSVVPYSVSGTATTGSTYATTQGNSAGAIGLFVKPDGTKMYHSDYVTGKVYQHSLSTAWDLSTASYDGSSSDLNLSGQSISYPNGIFFKSDGSRLYVAATTTNYIYEYALSTAWDLSSASYSQRSSSFSSQTSNSGPHTLAFKSDGTKLYISQTSSRIVYQYTLNTPWDTTTRVYDSVSFSYTSFAPGSTYIYFKSDGTKLYLNGSNNWDLYEVDLSTAWDLSTASYNSVSHDYADGFSSNISIKPDGTKFFSITYYPSSLMREYSMTASTPITITWDADIQWAGGTAPDSPAANEKDLYTITTDDGGTTYVGVQSGDNFS